MVLCYWRKINAHVKPEKRACVYFHGGWFYENGNYQAIQMPGILLQQITPPEKRARA